MDVPLNRKAIKVFFAEIPLKSTEALVFQRNLQDHAVFIRGKKRHKFANNKGDAFAPPKFSFCIKNSYIGSIVYVRLCSLKGL